MTCHMVYLVRALTMTFVIPDYITIDDWSDILVNISTFNRDRYDLYVRITNPDTGSM